jgi:hypothetical protein
MESSNQHSNKSPEEEEHKDEGGFHRMQTVSHQSSHNHNEDDQKITDVPLKRYNTESKRAGFKKQGAREDFD